MKVTSTVKINVAAIKHMTETAVKALEKTGEALHTEIVQAQVVPRRDGALQGKHFFVDASESEKGRVSLVHATPYARRMYYHPEYKFHKEPWDETIHHKDGTVSHLKHDGNPNARGEWFNDWKEGGRKGEFAQEAFERFYRI